MAMTLTGYIVSTAVSLLVLVGMTVTVVLVVRDANSGTHHAGPDPDFQPTFNVGVGIADMTGPIVEITFMGYAELTQRGQGLHTRQFSRAFIFEKGDERVVLVSAEIQAVGIAVRREVVHQLQELYGDMYSLRNVIVVGTHTHSTPGGYLVDFLLDVSILGFSRQTYNAYVDGITRSIIRAHENMVPTKLYFGQTRVWNAHMNRSPYSYQYNPAEERAQYDQDTDNTLSQIRIVKSDGTLHGVMNWFAVHTTSMNNTNRLVSSDNMGYAALKLEETLNPMLPTGKPEVIGAFFPANIGDVSPNTSGARCEYSGDECDNHFAVCELFERCYSLGPGDDMYESTRIIGTAVYEGALEVLNSPGEELSDEFAVVHQFIEFPDEVVAKYDPVTDTFDTSTPVQGCVASMGYSFASGTIDGANVLNITQGTIQGNPLIDSITGFVAGTPTEEDIECHAPKPILLATGRTSIPYPWHPRIASVSLIRIGAVYIAGVPGEPTTMSGRRIRRVVAAAAGAETDKVLVTGLTNEYIHYVATFEEYQVQRYEAASTIYGPNTLDILLNKFNELSRVAVEGGSVEAGPTPPDYRDNVLSLNLPVLFDSSPSGYSFGQQLTAPPDTVSRGDTVSVTFVAANPRNDLKQELSHVEVEAQHNGQWYVVANDADWETKFEWSRISTLQATSEATVSWTIPEDVISTSYRIRYYGASRALLGGVTQFQGVSDTFTVI